MTDLRTADWTVEGVSLALCQELVRRHHYSRGWSNTATFRHGLFSRDNPLLCQGVAWWIPPTRGAAIATWPGDWRRVLALSRLVVAPDVPTGGASFLLGRSIRLIQQAGGWECLVTYADSWRGHTGAIYRATNWSHAGTTASQPVYVDGAGRMQTRKKGQRTLTHDQMLARGYRLVGSFAKEKFVYPLVVYPLVAAPTTGVAS